MSGGFNSIMRNHLSDESNYKIMELIFSEAEYFDYDSKEWKTIQNPVSSKFENNDFITFVFILRDNTIESVLKILTANFNILVDNGFFDEIEKGTEITIRASNFIYMDNDFYYIAGIEFQGRTYLSFEQGLQNIVEYMDRHKIV